MHWQEQDRTNDDLRAASADDVHHEMFVHRRDEGSAGEDIDQTQVTDVRLFHYRHTTVDQDVKVTQQHQTTHLLTTSSLTASCQCLQCLHHSTLNVCNVYITLPSMSAIFTLTLLLHSIPYGSLGPTIPIVMTMWQTPMEQTFENQ